MAIDPVTASLRRNRSALTRAKKKGNVAIIAACEAAFAEFEQVGWPDQWMEFERAKNDAVFAYQRERGF